MYSLINGIKSACSSFYNLSSTDKAKSLAVTAVTGVTYLAASGLASDFFENAIPCSSVAVGAGCALAAHVGSQMSLPRKVCLGMGVAAASAGIMPSTALVGGLTLGGAFAGAVSFFRGSSAPQAIMNGVSCTAAVTSVFMGAYPLFAGICKAGTIFATSASVGLATSCVVNYQINPPFEGALAARRMAHPLAVIAGLAAGVGAALTVSPAVAVGVTAGAFVAVLGGGELFLEHPSEELYVQIPQGGMIPLNYPPNEIAEDADDEFEDFGEAIQALAINEPHELGPLGANPVAAAGG